jgi:hypothetical protein
MSAREFIALVDFVPAARSLRSLAPRPRLEVNPAGPPPGRLGRSATRRARHPQRGRRLRRGREDRESTRRRRTAIRPPTGEAQQPSPEQVSAIASRADRISWRAVAVVQPGGAEAVGNVSSRTRRNSQLRARCGRGDRRRRASAWRRIRRAGRSAGSGNRSGGRPPPGAAPISPRGAMFVLRACSADRYRLCGDVARAEAASSCAWQTTRRTCRPAVPARSPPHAGSVESVSQSPRCAIARVSTLAVRASPWGSKRE